MGRGIGEKGFESVLGKKRGATSAQRINDLAAELSERLKLLQVVPTEFPDGYDDEWNKHILLRLELRPHYRALGSLRVWDYSQDHTLLSQLQKETDDSFSWYTTSFQEILGEWGESYCLLDEKQLEGVLRVILKMPIIENRSEDDK